MRTLILFCACLFGVLLGFPTKWLWNWLMPNIFGLPVITFWQAVGMSILVRLVLGFQYNYKK